MAFTEAQRVRVRAVLGYPDVFRQHNPRLESALDIIGGRPDSLAEAVALLGEVDDLETALAAAVKTAGLKRAEDVEWYQSATAGGSAQVAATRAVGRRFAARLSTLLGVPIASDYFGERGYAGDAWMGAEAQGRGGITPLG